MTADRTIVVDAEVLDLIKQQFRPGAITANHVLRSMFGLPPSQAKPGRPKGFRPKGHEQRRSA